MTLLITVEFDESADLVTAHDTFLMDAAALAKARFARIARVEQVTEGGLQPWPCEDDVLGDFAGDDYHEAHPNSICAQSEAAALAFLAWLGPGVER